MDGFCGAAYIGQLVPAVVKLHVPAVLKLHVPAGVKLHVPAGVKVYLSNRLIRWFMPLVHAPICRQVLKARVRLVSLDLSLNW